MPDSIHLVCAHCGGVNRIPDTRDPADAACGKCHRPLLSGKPVALGDADFERFISRNDVPVVVDFWAEWCGPCRMMAPVFEQTAQSMEPGLRFAKVDTESARSVAARYNIRSIPTLIVFRNGQEVDRRSGALDGRTLAGWLSAHAA